MAANAEPDPLLGYEIVGTLGEGKFGTVKRLRTLNTTPAADIAVKICEKKHLLANGMSETEIETRLSLWQDMLENGLFEHASILRVLEAQSTAEAIFVFQEVAEGGDLFERLLRNDCGHFSEREAQSAARNLCSAIAHLHRRGLCHRDIKPENILYATNQSDSADVLLADFNLMVPIAATDTTVKPCAGTPGYIAPEILFGSVSAKADMWSFGVVCYNMLTGRAPFQGQSLESMAQELTERPVPYPIKYWSQIGVEARLFVQALLVPDPKARLSAEEALLHPWLQTSNSLTGQGDVVSGKMEV